MGFIFKYSPIYDKQWCLALGEEYDPQILKRFPAYLQALKAVLGNEHRIFTLIETYTGLHWQDKHIPVYFVSCLPISGFSDPLTIRIHDDHLRVIETLIHEAIHVILVQNKDKTQDVFVKLRKTYPDETKSTRVHIIVNSVTDRVFRSIYGDDEADRIQQVTRTYKGLKRAYELLDRMELKDNILESIRNL